MKKHINKYSYYYVLQCRYTNKWEDVEKETSLADAKRSYNTYVSNGYTPCRIIKRAVRRPTCCLCGDPIVGCGNNAYPLMQGMCCDVCNALYVVPERIKQYRKSKGGDK